MGEGALLIGFIAVQRLAELVLARRNTARLRAMGATEFGRSHYLWIVALHAAWLGGLWILGRDHTVDRFLLLIFILLQIGRIWVMVTLGQRWTTRIIVLPGERLVARGPYRWIRHPNYLIVCLEIALVPLALGLTAFGALFTLLNALVLFQRMRVEDAALQWATGSSQQGQTLANEP
jgi:methyltransferase